jgi:hypothetical protein
MTDEIRQLTYSETLCLHMLRYSAMGDYTKDMRPSEVKEKLEPFFPREMTDDMIKLIINQVPFNQFILQGTDPN